MQIKNKVGIVWDSRYLEHDTGYGHPERPERLLAVKQVIDTDPTLIQISSRMATTEEVSWVHSPQVIKTIENSRGKSEIYLDADTPVGPNSADAAFLACGGLIEAVEAVEMGKLNQAFAFPRPPGHHAEAQRSMGFCLFNHIAVAAEYLIRKKGKTRVAIMDYDVHHGNGTQHSFYNRKDVLYLSTHRFPFYPGTGAAHEKGSGEGLGYTVNVPLDGSSDDDDYARAFDETIIPALDDYKPEFVLVSAGFDAHQRDPLGGMEVTKKGFYEMSQKLTQIAQKHCGSKIVFVLEGGYDLKGISEGVEAVLEVIR